MENYDYLMRHNIEVIQGIDKIIELDDVVIVPKETFEKIVKRLDTISDDVRNALGELIELQNKPTTLAEFTAEFEQFVTKTEKILQSNN